MRENSGNDVREPYDDGDDPITLPGGKNIPKSVIIVLIALLAASVLGVLAFRALNGQGGPTIECPAPQSINETLECLENNPRSVTVPSQGA